MDGFLKHAILLFLAMRLGDMVNVAAGMWFVPKFVKPEDIGAVLPLASFATFLSLPMFAFAMTVMKETAWLAANRERGKVKSLLSGVFVATAVIMIVVIAVSAVVMPHFLDAIGVSEAGTGLLVIVAAFFGCVAPIYTDALQSLRRFGALATIEAVGSVVRFAVMLAVMPFKALAGYFAGQAALPVFRMLGSVFALRSELTVPSEPFWNRVTFRRVATAFVAILAYQAIPLASSLVEQTVLRTSFPARDSAGFYMVSRFADFLYCLTFPLLLVMFPYTASSAQKGTPTAPYVVRCSAVTLVAASLAAIVYFFFGVRLLSLMPNGAEYIDYAVYMPWLVLSNALTSCQVFYANAEVSAGRFGFLWWLAPLHLVYGAALQMHRAIGVELTMPGLIACFLGVSLIRFVFSAFAVRKDKISGSCGF